MLAILQRSHDIIRGQRQEQGELLFSFLEREEGGGGIQCVILVCSYGMYGKQGIQVWGGAIFQGKVGAARRKRGRLNRGRKIPLDFLLTFVYNGGHKLNERQL